MMRLKACLIAIISLWCHAGSGQSVADATDFADQQFKGGNYEVAVMTYKRVLFFGKEEISSFESYHKLADCLFQTQDYGQAAHYYDLAYYSTSDAGTQTEMTLNKASALLMQKKFKLALVELLNLSDSLGVPHDREKDFYLGIAYFGNGAFKESQEYFSGSLASGDSTASGELSELFVKNRKIDRLKPKVARVLSMIVPGAGQFYAGDIKNGFNSLLLSAGLGVLLIHVITTYTWLDAIISVFPWYQRYYTGGVKKAGIIAQNKIDRKRAVVFNEIIELVAHDRKVSE